MFRLPARRFQSLSAMVLAFASALTLVACAVNAPQPGAARDDVLRSWGQPTGRYSLPGGIERLEYATGPYGRTTWMVDVDGGGHVTQSRQVLNEAEFLRMQSAQASPGLQRDGLLQWLGRPGERRHGGRQGGEVWSYRYPTNDCLWFQVSVMGDGSVGSSGFFVDPSCDAPSDGFN